MEIHGNIYIEVLEVFKYKKQIWRNRKLHQEMKYIENGEIYSKYRKSIGNTNNIDINIQMENKEIIRKYRNV